LPSTGYSPAKKKGGRLLQGSNSGHLMHHDGISPPNALNACKDNLVDASDGNLDDNVDVNYPPTSAYKKLIQMTHGQRLPN
jgi:hypothetical protein